MTKICLSLGSLPKWRFTSKGKILCTVWHWECFGLRTERCICTYESVGAGRSIDFGEDNFSRGKSWRGGRPKWLSIVWNLENMVHVEVFKLPVDKEHLVHPSDTTGFRQKSHRPGLSAPRTLPWLYLANPGGGEWNGSLMWSTVKNVCKVVLALFWVFSLSGMLQSPARPIPVWRGARLLFSIPVLGGWQELLVTGEGNMALGENWWEKNLPLKRLLGMGWTSILQKLFTCCWVCKGMDCMTSHPGFCGHPSLFCSTLSQECLHTLFLTGLEIEK